MKVRVTITGTAFGARLTALCWCALTLLAPVAVSACSGSSSTPSIPTISPTVTNAVTGTPTVPATSTGTPASGSTTTTVPGPQTGTATATATITVPAPASKIPSAAPASNIPSAAPVTGGGGTAGLQDGLLFALGAAAILGGAGSIIYRRRLTRNR